LSSDDLLKDWLALTWPYHTIVQAAGNYWIGDGRGVNPPSLEYVNHKGCNALAIGNHNDNATGMSGTSTFRNPTSPHGDRELPQLAANGTAVSANEQTMSGTSMAAPAVAGVVALLQGISPSLKIWPETCRAILLAGANRSVAGGTWWGDVGANIDAKAGAGALDAQTGMLIAGQRRLANTGGVPYGWDAGRLVETDFVNKVTKSKYYVQVPKSLNKDNRMHCKGGVDLE
jgi:subtilisin family serine protease